jgi:hypothetical protein
VKPVLILNRSTVPINIRSSHRYLASSFIGSGFLLLCSVSPLQVLYNALEYDFRNDGRKCIADLSLDDASIIPSKEMFVWKALKSRKLSISQRARTTRVAVVITAICRDALDDRRIIPSVPVGPGSTGGGSLFIMLACILWNLREDFAN